LVRPFPRRPKGRFDEVLARNPIAITATPTQKPVQSMRAQAPGRYPAWGQVSGPCALGIVGLAIAVVLWGYGYKLSLYHRNTSHSARIPVAKLWIEPRGASVTTASRIKAISHLVPGPQAFSARIQPLPSPSRAFACIPPLNECRVAFFDLLIPSRAPPPLRFLFA
jgi:hypothetical protein